MAQTVIRLIGAALVTLVAIVLGVTLTGTLDTTADPNSGVVAGANTVMLVITVAVLVGVLAYALIEYAQTGAIRSIARQFDTRTIVLIPIAIAINIVLGQTVSQALNLPLYLDSIGTILVGVLAGPIPGMVTGLFANLIWTFVLAGTPFGSPYAWPFAIVAAEIGLLAGVFGWLGFFRSRPDTPLPRLVVGAVVAVLALGALAYVGILPAYTDGVALFGDLSEVAPVFVAVGYAVAAALALAAVLLVVQLFVRRNLAVAYVVVAGAICGVVSALISAPISAYAFGGVTGGGAAILVAAFQQAGASLNEAVVQQGLIQDTLDKTVTYVVVFALLGTLSRRFVARFPQGERAVGTIEG